MIICNWCLVRALRRSSAMQKRCCRLSSTASARLTTTLSDSAVDIRLMSHRDGTFSSSRSYASTPPSAGHRITPTLVALVVLFLVLVGPSEILQFIQDFVMTPQVKLRTLLAFQRSRYFFRHTYWLLAMTSAENLTAALQQNNININLRIT